jgi:hypothetical protein
VTDTLRLGSAALTFGELASLSYQDLRLQLERLEEGHLLREFQVDNLLEGDFFSWYVAQDQWTSALYQAIKGLIVRLSEYEGRGAVLKPGAISDLFRQLYQSMIPGPIRHDLGEYYTPRWLAQATLAAVPKPPGWRGLDPCCGSGTFVVEMIAIVLNEVQDLAQEAQLREILSRIKGMDLNPIAVLSMRVNYLLAIAPLLASTNVRVELPIYLGDAAYIPSVEDLGGIPALVYKLGTEEGVLDFALPLALANDQQRFGSIMWELEQNILRHHAEAARACILNALDPTQQNLTVVCAISTLVDNLLRLEQRSWNHIWVRIIKNYVATMSIGTFDCVIGNPPWVEWKDLPNGYRETIKELCRSRGLFSDDKYAGGTDLNIAALIAHTVLEQWVKPEGYLCFLMPRSLLQVRSTQGFRRWMLPDGTPLRLVQLDDWSALQAFGGVVTNPVGYLVQRNRPQQARVPLRVFEGEQGGPATRPAQAQWMQVRQALAVKHLLAVQVGENGDPYLIDETENLSSMTDLLGETSYRGRRATETSPQAITWLKYLGQPQSSIVLVENNVNPQAKKLVAKSRYLLETIHLYPMIQGKHVRAFGVEIPGHVVLLPHDVGSGQEAIPEEQLRKFAPMTMKYFTAYRTELENRGSRREYRSAGPFYSYWRVGPYTFAPFKVVWPEIGQLRAAVISTTRTPWGEEKLIIPEGKVNLIACGASDEAHFVCGYLNAPLVRRAYQNMSSAIGRPVRLPFAIPGYDKERWTHRAIAAVSLAAHEGRCSMPDFLLAWLLKRLTQQNHRNETLAARSPPPNDEGRKTLKP